MIDDADGGHYGGEDMQARLDLCVMVLRFYCENGDVLRRGLGLGAGYGAGYGVVGEGGVGGYGGDGEKGRDEGMARRGGWPVETLYLGMVGMHIGMCMGTVWRIEIGFLHSYCTCDRVV